MIQKGAYAVNCERKKIEFSARVHYLWNSANNDPYVGLNVRTLQPGQAFHLNYATSYEVWPISARPVRGGRASRFCKSAMGYHGSLSMEDWSNSVWFKVGAPIATFIAGGLLKPFQDWFAERRETAGMNRALYGELGSNYSNLAGFLLWCDEEKMRRHLRQGLSFNAFEATKVKPILFFKLRNAGVLKELYTGLDRVLDGDDGAPLTAKVNEVLTFFVAMVDNGHLDATFLLEVCSPSAKKLVLNWICDPTRIRVMQKQKPIRPK